MTEEDFGKKIYGLMCKIFPIMRSITGEGNRRALKILSEIIPLETKEIQTGKKVFDWTIPKEWNIREAWVKNPNGEKIIDLKNSNLHVVNYSVPFRGKISLEELKSHLYTLPKQPDKIPYITSYYKERWGFCLSQNEFDKLEDGVYEVLIDSELKDGSLSYGEIFIPGKSEKEILISSYFCHPSQANDSLSGVALCTFLAKELSTRNLNYSYRFLFIPETIGAIAWLSLNEDKVKNIIGGYVVTCVGDSGPFTYKKSRAGNHLVDNVAIKVLEENGEEFKIREFDPSDGSDERQFSSLGFKIPMGSLMKTKYGEFKEYHNSGDNLDFMSVESLEDSFKKYLEIIEVLEKEDLDKFNLIEKSISEGEKYLNLNPKCEPQLGKRGLYETMGGRRGVKLNEEAIFWVLSFSDGEYSLEEISERSGIVLDDLRNAAIILVDKGLLRRLI